MYYIGYILDLGRELLIYRGCICSALVDSAEQLSRVVEPNHPSSRIYENSSCFPFSPPLDVAILFDFSCFGGYRLFVFFCVLFNAYEFHLIITTTTTISRVPFKCEALSQVLHRYYFI